MTIGHRKVGYIQVVCTSPSSSSTFHFSMVWVAKLTLVSADTTLVRLESRSRVQNLSFFLIYMVETLPHLSIACPPSLYTFFSLPVHIRKREKGKKEKRNINTIVFAQSCLVFHSLTSAFDAPVFPFCQISSLAYLLATHDCFDTVERRRIRRGIGLRSISRLSGCWSASNLDRLSGCLCLCLCLHAR